MAESLALRLGFRDGVGGMRFPHGKWDREQPHVCEIVNVYDDERREYIGCYASCGTCGDFGELYPESQAFMADAEAVAHERKVWERKRLQQRVLGPVF